MNIFQQITDYVKKEHTTFPMDNNWLGSINGFGSLNSIYHKIVIAGDTWKLGHNIMVKLPPLIAPSFTRIKGIVNSYYCSFASVWNYWNSFISDKPEDVFLSRSLSMSYKGKFVEPCVRMSVIAFICKVAHGYFDDLASSSDKFSVQFNQGTVNVKIRTVHLINDAASDIVPVSLTWGYNNKGERICNRYSNIANIGSAYSFDYDGSYLSLQFRNFGSGVYGNASSLGFATLEDYFIFCCQECQRNLSNHGIPTELLAMTDIAFYSEDYYNLLPAMCESSIWHNFYRDEQNQSPEFDYREVNGCIGSPQNFYGAADSSMPYGWKLRLLGIPPNVSTGSDYWYPVDSQDKVFAVLTGFCLEDMVRYYFQSMSSATDITILPKSYNGLLRLKYRNFEKDYFTSACVDPNFGGVSVQVPNTIDALRTASKLEEFLEVSASARDFFNFMKHIFGTNPESTRYQRPLLLGTQVVPIQIGEQLQTSQTTTGVNGSPLGDRAGVADGYGNSGTVNHFFNEHGIVVSFLSFVLDAQYMQGLPFEFWHHKQLDYPFPEFANLGAESIPVKEIYYSNQNLQRNVGYTEGDNNAVIDHSSFQPNTVDAEFTNHSSQSGEVLNSLNVTYRENSSGVTVSSAFPSMPVDLGHSGSVSVFGYTPRYTRWKFAQDVVAGQLRDRSMNFWHTFRKFSSQPFISNAFVSYQDAGYLSDLNRIFAVVNDNADKFIVDCFNNGSVRRSLPYSPSTTID